VKSKTLVAAIAAALSVTITLVACGRASSDASCQTSQNPTTTTTATVSSTTGARPSTLVDELVAVHGARLHGQCDGAGPTTVVLIAGFNTGSDIWALIEPTASQRTRVCSYDRLGNGTSDAPPAPQTFATEAADLHALLQAAGEPGPYAIVGHSFRGPER
jgi:pimeloyl-ACP methyl ester carboxylesterase